MNESEANKLIKNSVNNEVINDTGKINQINKKLSKIKFGVLFFKYISHILFILIILIFFPLAFVKLNIFNFNNNKFLLPIVNYILNLIKSFQNIIFQMVKMIYVNHMILLI
jgi:hypothetical protein